MIIQEELIMKSNGLKRFTKERIRYYEKYLKKNPDSKLRSKFEAGIQELKSLL